MFDYRSLEEFNADMDWIKATIYTTTQGIEPVSGRLMQLGITGLVIEDESEFNDFLEETKAYWD